MRCRFLLSAVLLGLSSFASAGMVPGRIAIQGALATGGTLGIGVVDFTEKTELGLTLSGSFNNAPNQTKTITPVLFGGFRNALCENTYFAYGIDALGTFGKVGGISINSDYAIGPYISLEQMLTNHIMLSGWIEPYQYHYVKLGSIATTNNGFFTAGGLAINYLF